MLQLLANKVHDKKRVWDKDLFDLIRLQTWFPGYRARYRVVDESRDPGESSQHVASASQSDNKSDDYDDSHDNDHNDDSQESDQEDIEN